MQAVHELGHVVGAVATGGSVDRVVLHPLSISRTDVSPNPRPGIVVWFGPILGSIFPLLVAAAVSRLGKAIGKLASFFAGFCLIANGAYIAAGSFDGVGDCGVMLATGSPQWVLIVFGAVAISMGLGLWHRIGSLSNFLFASNAVTLGIAYATMATALLVAIAEVIFFSS